MVAMGFPRRVTSIGRPVRFTLSRTARHVALNWEMVIDSFISMLFELRVELFLAHCTVRIPWSKTMVNKNLSVTHRIETGDDNISLRSKFNGIEKNELSEPGRSRSHLDCART